MALWIGILCFAPVRSYISLLHQLCILFLRELIKCLLHNKSLCVEMYEPAPRQALLHRCYRLTGPSVTYRATSKALPSVLESVLSSNMSMYGCWLSVVCVFEQGSIEDILKQPDTVALRSSTTYQVTQLNNQPSSLHMASMYYHWLVL